MREESTIRNLTKTLSSLIIRFVLTRIRFMNQCVQNYAFCRPFFLIKTTTDAEHHGSEVFRKRCGKLSGVFLKTL